MQYGIEAGHTCFNQHFCNTAITLEPKKQFLHTYYNMMTAYVVILDLSLYVTITLIAWCYILRSNTHKENVQIKSVLSSVK